MGQEATETTFIDPKSALAAATTAAIRGGDVAALSTLLSDNPGLATAHIGTESEARSLLHVLTDWPGRFPNGAATAGALVAAGADVDARFVGAHVETPLHWAASCDDVAVLDALLDAGADIDAPGAVIGGGTPLADARAFLQLAAARRLIERGASVGLQDAAALGLLDRVEAFYSRGTGLSPPLSKEETSWAFWNACHGGQLAAARFLRGKGADVDVVPPWPGGTPLDAARKREVADLVSWLEEIGAKSDQKQQ